MVFMRIAKLPSDIAFLEIWFQTSVLGILHSGVWYNVNILGNMILPRLVRWKDLQKRDTHLISFWTNLTLLCEDDCGDSCTDGRGDGAWHWQCHWWHQRFNDDAVSTNGNIVLVLTMVINGCVNVLDNVSVSGSHSGHGSARHGRDEEMRRKSRDLFGE